MDLDQSVSLMVVTAAAALLPMLARLVRVPSPVLEIAFGVVLGRSFLDLQSMGGWMPFLAQLGFLVLMLHAGMEIDFKALASERPGRLVLHVAVFGLSLCLALGCAWLLGQGLFMALVLGTTSLGLVLPSLKDAGLGKTPLAQTILIAATLADFLTLLGLAFFDLYQSYGPNWRLGLPLVLFAGFGLLLWAGRWWAWWHPEVAGRLLRSADPQEQGVRWSLALLFLFVGLSEVVGLEPVLGAFMGGSVIAFVFREKAELESKLSALGFGFLIPIFFINVGMGFDLGNLAHWPILGFTALLVVLSLVVKLLPALLYAPAGLGLRGALQAGLLLSARLSLVIAAAQIGVSNGLLTPEVKDSVVLLALVTCFVGPTLFKLLHRETAAAVKIPPPRPPKTTL